MYKELMYVIQVQLYNYKNPHSRIKKLCETVLFLNVEPHTHVSWPKDKKH